MAGRENPATVEDRTPPYIREAGDGIDTACIRKVIGPQRSPVFNCKGIKLAGRIGRYDNFAFDRGARAP